MSKHPLYTFIVAHYNQYHYLYTALDSVMRQDYPNVEVIIVDDGSKVFDKDEVEGYLNTNKPQNIKSAQVLVNDENVGIVRSLNRALGCATGSYIQIFAADDCLSDEKVASTFVSEFERPGSQAEAICARAMLADEGLAPTGKYYLGLKAHRRYNSLDAQGQFQQIAVRCDLSMGSTCARRELYQRLGPFSERYRHIEDWPFFINLIKNNVRINTIDYRALERRAGGISQTSWTSDSAFAEAYLDETLTVIETEILPHLRTFPLETQRRIFQKYSRRRDAYMKVGGKREELRLRDFWQYSKKLVVWQLLPKRQQDPKAHKEISRK